MQCVQVLLRACVGIDYHELLQMLCLLAQPRLAEVNSLTPPSLPPPFSDLRDLITQMSLCSDFTFFGTRDLCSKEPPLTPADRLREVIENCSTLTRGNRAGSTCMEKVMECLPVDLKVLVGSVNDVLAGTLYALRIFELNQIVKILRELLTDTDMLATTQKDICLAHH